MKPGLLDRALAPADSLSEILFGLIMTLTFTLGAGVLVREEPDAARELLLATLGCNIAWGLIDALMYLAGQRFERGRRARLADAIRAEATEDRAARIVAGRRNRPRRWGVWVIVSSARRTSGTRGF